MEPETTDAEKSARFHIGHYLVNRLNITIIIGLPLAMLGYLYANRFISVPEGAPNYEIYSFFSIWLGSFILACVTPQQHIWRMQLKILICAAFILPLIDIYYLVSCNILILLRLIGRFCILI